MKKNNIKIEKKRHGVDEIIRNYDELNRTKDALIKLYEHKITSLQDELLMLYRLEYRRAYGIYTAKLQDTVRSSS
jgi:hypothetical protein